MSAGKPGETKPFSLTAPEATPASTANSAIAIEGAGAAANPAETIADLRASLAERDAEIRWLKAELRRTDELRREGAEANRRLNAAAADLGRAYDFYAAKAGK